ncbi:hypothetical protein [Aquimonas sp.]|jgi:hypothetical protein|uniref:hypothetical protein n=1 Tax=Aquimonas sp. TaxID=1872588 RepID=UPI0037BFD895
MRSSPPSFQSIEHQIQALINSIRNAEGKRWCAEFWAISPDGENYGRRGGDLSKEALNNATN